MSRYKSRMGDIQTTREAWVELGEACREFQMAILNSLHIPGIVDWLAKRIYKKRGK